MKSLMYRVMALLLLSLGLAGCVTGGHEQAAKPQPVEIVVSAAASLKDALSEIDQSYRQEHPEVIVRYNLGASGALQHQIEQGAKVDVFIAAADKNMDELEKGGLIDKASRRVLVKNDLVLIAPADSNVKLATFADLAKPAVAKIAVGAPASVPAGQYAEEVLRKIGIWEEVTPKLVQAKDVRQVLTYVELGDVDAGLVYKTDAAVSKKVKVIAVAPTDSHKSINYPLAVIAATQARPAAESFANYLSGPKAKAIFEKYGFGLGQ